MNIRPDPHTEPLAYKPPKKFIGQDSLPHGYGDKQGDLICTHCMQPYNANTGHTMSQFCTKACGCCGTMDHQGRFCPARYVTWKFYSKNLRRFPRSDEGVKFWPDPQTLVILKAAGYSWATDLTDVADTKVAAPKRTIEDAGLPDTHDAKRQRPEDDTIMRLETKLQEKEDENVALRSQLADTQAELALIKNKLQAIKELAEI
ncbi:unnamed protein product [Periconia digitata]|uniref:Uncharacterized protein n=1 Tax=Periconia digitata TaxID=1303443 RepID=A0A9W4UD83_9PLEO|nr:unnamed protein product [Periconia digitata]